STIRHKLHSASRPIWNEPILLLSTMSATLTTLAAVSTRIQYTGADLPQYGHSGELIAPRDLARFQAPQAKILLPSVAEGNLIQRQVARFYDVASIVQCAIVDRAGDHERVRANRPHPERLRKRLIIGVTETSSQAHAIQVVGERRDAGQRIRQRAEHAVAGGEACGKRLHLLFH